MKIILIGFMCSGKTTVAPLIASKLSLEVIETDELVRQLAGKTTDEIFKQEGEVGYREYEIAVAKQIRNKEKVIISTGGGVVMNKIILDYLKQNAKTVFLKTSFEALQKRLANTFPRPLFDNIEQAKKIYDFRYPLYKEYSDLTIETDDKLPEEVASEILKKIKNI